MEVNQNATLMNGTIGTLLVNSVRWAGGGSGTTIRVGGPYDSTFVTDAGIANLKRVAVSYWALRVVRGAAGIVQGRFTL